MQPQKVETIYPKWLLMLWTRTDVGMLGSGTSAGCKVYCCFLEWGAINRYGQAVGGFLRTPKSAAGWNQVLHSPLSVDKFPIIGHSFKHFEKFSLWQIIYLSMLTQNNIVLGSRVLLKTRKALGQKGWSYTKEPLWFIDLSLLQSANAAIHLIDAASYWTGRVWFANMYIVLLCHWLYFGWCCKHCR